MDNNDNYFERINKRESYILFLRRIEKPDVAYYTLEVEPDGTVRQKRTEFNRQHSDIELAEQFLLKWQKQLKYRRRKPKIRILSREQIRILLSAAKNRKWFLEILLGLYLGLRKGEILGLKFSDFNMEKRTVHIQRQLVADITIEENGMKIEDYTIVERDPKTEKSNRVLRVPTIILVELEKRRRLVEAQKTQMEDQYVDNEYISCRENGMPHGLTSLNTELLNS